MPKTKIPQLNFRKHVSYSNYHYRGSLLYWILLFLFFVSFISLAIIKVDVTVQSRGLVKTFNKISPIAVPITAKVLQVRISENLYVNAKDTLLVFDQSGLESELSIKQEQLDLYTTYIRDIEELVRPGADKQIRSKLYQKEYIDFKANSNKLQRKINKLRVDFDRTKLLFEQGVVAEVILQEDSFNLKESEDELKAFDSQLKAEWEMQKRNYTVSSQDVLTRLKILQQEKQQHCIIAPYNGHIIDFNGVAIGSFVNENDIIAYLSPEDDLIVESYVPSSDIGLINEGMEVRFQIDAFNYNQWGLMMGEVIEIAQDVTKVNDVYVYVVRSRMTESYLKLSNGLEGKVKKGMSLTGRFVVTRRTLFQLIFDNLDDWLNPKIIKSKTAS
ncbi:HlyD family secretion protein [Carboxylicivirga sp. N1Y90]|uniref:HlyD family secretion protein n=1 Tax=Carboxylicivirga fragile TaxID=3417571 RepID=UPI003D3410BA|nr:HlyD family efflux transporter periplasmic adaptor subunit [Marinilabiliaceae bacterium N1Y90]